MGVTRPNERDWFGSDFSIQGGDHQLPPEFANSGEPWNTWLILGGRGAGKTRAGAEWVRSVAVAQAKGRIALIGETEH
jgi:phage terminase large subunit-like protein